MDDMQRRIADIETRLRESSVGGVDDYVRKLRASVANADNFEDLFFEGQAALVLAGNGFGVEMRDSPDLAVQYQGHQFFAEVKHFREKEQDKLDDRRLDEEAGPTGRSVACGNIAEGGVAPWQQVRDVLLRKTRQYDEDTPFVIMIMSSSRNCVEEAQVQTAKNRIDDAVCNGDSELSRLSGVVFWGPEFNIGRWRQTFFYRTCAPRFPLPDIVADALEEVRR